MNYKYLAKSSAFSLMAVLLLLSIILEIYINTYNGVLFTSSTVQFCIVFSMLLVFVVNVITKYNKTKTFDPLAPWILFPFFYIVVLGVGSVRWIVEQKSSISLLLILAFLGLLSYLLGLTFSFRRLTQTSVRYKNISSKRLRLIVLLLMIVGVVFAALFYYRAGIPLLQSDLLDGRVDVQNRGAHNIMYLARLISISFLFSFAYKIGDNIGSIKNQYLDLRITVLFILAFVFMLSTASRSDIFLLAFMTLALYYNSAKKSYGYSLGIKGLVLFLSIIGYGFYRVFTSDQSQLEYLVSVSTDYGFNESYFSAFAIYMFYQLAAYSGNLLSILDYYPSDYSYFYGYLYPVTLLTALPGKQETVGEMLKENLGFVFSGGGVNPTIIGELYLDFGIPWVVLIMFIYGVLTNTLYVRMVLNRIPSNVILYSFVTFCLVLSTTGGFFSQISRTYYLFVIMVCIRFIHASITKSIKHY